MYVYTYISIVRKREGEERGGGEKGRGKERRERRNEKGREEGRIAMIYKRKKRVRGEVRGEGGEKGKKWENPPPTGYRLLTLLLHRDPLAKRHVGQKHGEGEGVGGGIVEESELAMEEE